MIRTDGIPTIAWGPVPDATPDPPSEPPTAEEDDDGPTSAA